MVVVVVVVVVVENVPQKVPPKLAQFSGVVWPLILKQAQNPPRNKQGTLQKTAETVTNRPHLWRSKLPVE